MLGLKGSRDSKLTFAMPSDMSMSCKQVLQIPQTRFRHDRQYANLTYLFISSSLREQSDATLIRPAVPVHVLPVFVHALGPPCLAVGIVLAPFTMEMQWLLHFPLQQGGQRNTLPIFLASPLTPGDTIAI